MYSKLKCNFSSPLQAVQRALRAKGETYFTVVQENNETKYLQRQPKKMKARCSGIGCKKMSNRHCSEITDSQREELFRHYWKDLDKEQKKLFLCENVFEDTTARIKDLANACKKKGKIIQLMKNTRREATFRYFLPVKNKKIQVCQAMFVGTLCIPDKRVRIVVKGGYGLLQDAACNASLYCGVDLDDQKDQDEEKDQKIKFDIKVLSDESESSSSDSENEQDYDDLCDDKSSSDNSDSEEEVLSKKIKKEVFDNIDDDHKEVSTSGWYRKTGNNSLRERCTGCKKQCIQISDSDRESIFDHFWNNLDKKGRDKFVRDLIVSEKTARAKMIEEAFEKNGALELDEGDIPKRHTRKYYLPKGLGNEKVHVCMNMFEGTLAIGSSKIKRIMKIKD